MTDNKRKRNFILMNSSTKKSSSGGRRRRHNDDDDFDDDEQQNNWKPVNVSLNQGGDDGDDGDDGNVASSKEGEDTHNHYDNPKLIRTAKKDLPVQPGEDVGIFFGLEVLTNYQTVDSLPTNDDDKNINETTTSSSSKVKKKKKNKKKQKDNDINSEDKPATDDNNDQKAKADIKKGPSLSKEKHQQEDSEKEPIKKKSKKKKKKKKTDDAGDGNGNFDTKDSNKMEQQQQQQEEEEEVVSQEQQQHVSQTWCQETSGAVLHPTLVEALAKRNFIHPTPIQSATLSASILGRRNLVGAAPTGSGKTLAFLLPILHSLLEEDNEHDDDDDDESSDENHQKHRQEESSFVQALIVTPTRELATQIHSECDLLVKDQCVSLVGGIAIVKQKRLLTQKKPRIIIGTPGRLWAMISNGEHDHLKDLSRIKFLVLDEADRMTQDHCFPQLIQILDSINRANPCPNEDDDTEDEDEDSDNNEDRLLGLPGIRGEAPLMMLNDDILQQIEEQKQALDPETREVDDDEFPAPEQSGDDDEASSSEADADRDPNVESMDEDGEEEEEDEQPKVHRQTFIYSATLTLPFTRTSSKPSNKRRKKNSMRGLDGAIADILEKAQAMGETKIVDLSSSKTSATTNKPAGVRLPPGLTLEQIKCTQRHKDSHLFAYLMTTAQGASGPCLVFCNSIAAVRRVGSTLQTLGLPVKMLHAHMQQRARFKAVESLNGPKKRCVVVCTDVAARGLDIPSVSTIVHYDTARTVDLFVHRSGRTARGIGESAVGSSLSLVAPAEDKAQSKLIESLGVSFKKALLDGRLLSAAQERVNLASKIISAAEIEQKSNSHNRWFLEKAKETDLEIDDDLLETDDNRTEREQAQLKEARKAEIKLDQLLREPMKTQRYGKFLSTNTAAKQPDIQPIKPPKVGTSKRKRHV